MFRNFIEKAATFYHDKNRWWLPLVAGSFYSLALPPFHHETHWALSLFPLLNFIVLLPLFVFAVHPLFRRSLWHLFLFGYAAAFGQYHWLVFDRVEGLWGLVILGLFLASAVVACFYLVAGLLFRYVEKRMGHTGVFVFPALWVLIDYARSLGDIAFPWAFLGYSFTPITPFAQGASIAGVWGLTWIAVFGNMVAWTAIKRSRRAPPLRSLLRLPLLFVFLIAAICAAGGYRIARYSPGEAPHKKIALLQSNIDQFRWSNAMLDTAFAVSESLVVASSAEKPDLMILPESSLLCFLNHRKEYRERVFSWVSRTGVPLLFGSLDWQDAPRTPDAHADYLVYNTAFFADTGSRELGRYYKARLVPFSEAIPFEGFFPLLSRVNLGEADFSRGTEPTVFSAGGIALAPLICYESIFPGYVRSRVRRGVNLMVNITNDGWFGRSSGPRHHAMMARMRSIENGVSLARCANSGISMFVDPLGRVLGETGLYERTILTAQVPLCTIPTLYRKFGDWFIGLCVLLVLFGAAVTLAGNRRQTQR